MATGKRRLRPLVVNIYMLLVICIVGNKAVLFHKESIKMQVFDSV